MTPIRRFPDQFYEDHFKKAQVKGYNINSLIFKGYYNVL